ncbi:hypothetical protein X777_07841 [Ooceraea biroi]|uniref:Uncharacterized protein n=1 Tax=Ooceraea biroi TaxID=2015173 RepID=A0A026X091_OOCBI|nr:hypothetical protein X777_07841 [Ooceraea biroi]
MPTVDDCRAKKEVRDGHPRKFRKRPIKDRFLVPIDIPQKITRVPRSFTIERCSW